jgi:hypothetical protein
VCVMCGVWCGGEEKRGVVSSGEELKGVVRKRMKGERLRKE